MEVEQVQASLLDQGLPLTPCSLFAAKREVHRHVSHRRMPMRIHIWEDDLIDQDV